jgi:hypothetical protein
MAALFMWRLADCHCLVVNTWQDIVPLIGARRRDRLNESLQALDLARIEQVIPAGAAAGERYLAPLMVQLDNERGWTGIGTSAVLAQSFVLHQMIPRFRSGGAHRNNPLPRSSPHRRVV